MKTSILVILVALTASAANAQINRGAWLLGASSTLSFNSYSYKGSPDVSIFNASIKGGYFVVKNLAFGLNLGYTSISESGSQTVTTIGAFSRYYLPKNFFFGAGVNSLTSSYNNHSTNMTSVPLEAGIAAFITKNIAIEPSINYVIGDNKTGPASTFGVNVGFSIYLNRE